MGQFIREPGLILKMGVENRKLAEEKCNVNKVNEVILEALEIE